MEYNRISYIANVIEHLHYNPAIPKYDRDRNNNRFNMRVYQHEDKTAADSCNTPGCIAGWTEHLFPEFVDKTKHTRINASNILGLDELWTRRLFEPNHSLGDGILEKLTPLMASNALHIVMQAGDDYKALTARDLWIKPYETHVHDNTACVA